jgi:hypothetical protein
MNATTIKPADLVEEYIKLRDLKEQAKARYTAFVQEHCDSRMDQIEGQLLNILNALGVDSLAGKTGTAYRNTMTSVTTADMREFRRHVIGSEAWDLCDWKPNKTRINELVAAGEELPPGVNRTQIYTIGIRRGK